MKRWLLALRLALAALVRNRLHSGLTALGIVIGTGAVVVVIHGSRSASQKILADVDGLISADGFVLNPQPPMIGSSRPALTEADAQSIANEVASVVSVATYVDTRATVVRTSHHVSTRISGVTQGYFDVRRYQVAQGNLWNGAQEASKSSVCVLGSAPARSLFPSESALGQQVRIAGSAFKVIGVLAARGGSSGNDQDDRILVPLSSFRARVERSATGRVDAIFVKAAAVSSVAHAASSVDKLLSARYRLAPRDPRGYKLTTQHDLRKSQEEVSRTLSLLLVGVAGISLLAGGAGVMNVMLGSVTERTYEIGVRMALGARARDILGQFLLEAVLVCALGGLVGALLGVLGAFLVAEALAVPFRADVAVLLGATGVSVAVGLLFGIVPAHRAARIDPIEALRSR